MKHGKRRSALVLFTGFALGALAPQAEAQTPLPLGPQTPANTVTAGNQDQTAVAMDAAGNYVVVWRDEPLDGGNSEIVARRFSFDPTVPPSAQFVVNVTTAGDQRNPAIAMNANGRFVIAWESVDPTNPAATDIFATLRNPNGSAVVAEFPVNTTLAGNQARPAVAVQSDGRFLITWQDTSVVALAPSGTTFDIAGRFYPANFPTGLPGAPVRLNIAAVGGDQEQPAVIPISTTGGWQVGWQGPTGPPIVPSVWVRVLASDGTGQPEFPVNTSSTNSPRSHIALAANSLGNSVAVWQDQFANSIFARMLDAGVPLGSEEQINASPDHLNREPSVALSQFGDFVTVWVEAIAGFSDSDAPEGSPIVILGRRRNAGGNFTELFPPPTDSEFPVNSGGADFAEPVIAGKAHGSFVAVWQGTDPADSSGLGISARRFLDAAFADDFETSDTSRWSDVFP